MTRDDELRERAVRFRKEVLGHTTRLETGYDVVVEIGWPVVGNFAGPVPLSGGGDRTNMLELTHDVIADICAAATRRIYV